MRCSEKHFCNNGSLPFKMANGKEIIEMAELQEVKNRDYPMAPNLLHDINPCENFAILPQRPEDDKRTNDEVNDGYLHWSEYKRQSNSTHILKVDYGCPNNYSTSKSNSSELLLDKNHKCHPNVDDINPDKINSSDDKITDFYLKISSDKKIFGLAVVLVFLMGLCLGSIFGFLFLKKIPITTNHCTDDVASCKPTECKNVIEVSCDPFLRTKCSQYEAFKEHCPQLNHTANIWNDLEHEDSTKNNSTPIASSFVKDELGWVYFDKGSLNGSKYIIVSKFMTFQVAQDHCKKIGGHLVHINSIREQIFVEDYLSSELKSDPFPQSIGYWLGARRPRGGHSGVCMYEQWKWIDAYGRTHGTIKGFTAFVPGKPDNLYYPEECLYLTVSEGTHESRFLKWDDAMCDLPNAGIQTFCEVELFQQR